MTEQYVTRGEFRATIGPMQSDISEIKKDVKAIRVTSDERSFLGTRGRHLINTILPSMVVSGLIALVSVLLH